VDVQELCPGLWRWTTRHPEWTPEEGGGDGWEPDVGCVFHKTPACVVLIDPLIPSGAERGPFLRALDRDIEKSGGPPAVLLTIYWHERSAEEVAARYEGATVWAPERTLRRMEISVTNPFSPGDDLPGGVEAHDSRRNGEVLYWLPGPRTLVAGDVLLGTTEGGLRVCPDSWLPEDVSPTAFRESLRTLLELPVERVLPAHGAPVVENVRAELERALDPA
jgi:glyoxylase-like metal-dependent hydrolase (beta-lactamase superfamily II)